MNTSDVFETPHDSPADWAFMLTAYLDETAHEGRGVMILAGFLGTAEQWRVCEHNWRIGLGKRQHLHMKELRWSKPNMLQKLLDDLGVVPHNAGLRAVVTSTAMSDYDNIVSGTKIEPYLKSYYFSLIGMINLIAQYIEPEETFKIVLELNHQYQINIPSIFSATKGLKTSSGHPKLLSIESVNKEATVLTEPGDYLAYALLQNHRDPESERAKLTSPILKLQKPAFFRQHQNQPELLRELVSQLAQRHPHLMEKRETDQS